MHCASFTQLERQAVPLPLQVYGAQFTATPWLHVPAPHVGAECSVLATHDTAPQVAPGATCSHVPPAAQLPVLPHVPGAHCPAGAGVPAVTLPQVPSTWPVSAFVHALHVPLHAALQQTPLAQCPLVQALLWVHG